MQWLYKFFCVLEYSQKFSEKKNNPNYIQKSKHIGSRNRFASILKKKKQKNKI